MRPPKNLAELPSLTKSIDGQIKVWCVECERWSNVIVIANATVTYRQSKFNKTEGAHDFHYHCGTYNCKADIEYLLNEFLKTKILDLADVPVARLKPVPEPRQRVIEQMRMEI